MGLLETLIARVTKLEEIAGATATTSVESPVAPAAPVTPSAPAPVASDALINDHGVVWHKDFHAATKTENNDGSWKRRRGVDKDAADAYEAQFAKGTSETMLTGSGVTETPSGVITPVTPAAPVTPAVPSAPALPATPAKPAVPSAPSTPAGNPDQHEAIKLINVLTNTYKVPYPLIISALVAKHGVTAFDQIDKSKFAEVKVAAGEWVELLALVDEAVETIDAINEDTDNAHGLSAAVTSVFNDFGGSPTAGGIELGKLPEVVKVITKMAEDWNTWFQASKA